MAKVLLVEDIEAVRVAMGGVLSTIGGHEVISASDGTSGLALLDTHKIEVIVTDIWMPGEDGIALLREAKRRFPGLPVIIVTGGGPNFPPIELTQSVVESHGADRLLIKPFDDEDLLAAVAELTGKAA